MREALLHLLKMNEVIVYATYGQVFFVLGLAVALQARQTSRLELAGSLPLLAGFGLAHGMNEWGYVFIPIQATYLRSSIIELLYVGQLFLLVSSFAMLLRFGIKLNTPDLFSPRWGRIVPWTWYGLWWVSLLVAWLFGMGEPSQLHDRWEILTRYTMGLPGAALAAYGLRRHALERIRPLDLPHIVSYLRLAGLALAAYAFFAGLVVPAAPFFPANILNIGLLERATGVTVPLFRSACGLVMAYGMIRAMEVFEIETEQRIEDAERRYVLASERERIGRELHDGTIQSIYAAGLMIDDAARRLADDPATARTRLGQAMNSLNQTIQDIRRYIFELKAVNGSAGLNEEVEALVKDFRVNTLIDVELRVEGRQRAELSPARRQEVVQIVREALSNVSRHAQARRVEVILRWAATGLHVEVKDDGVGFEAERMVSNEDVSRLTEESTGHGLANMRERARLMGGRLEIHTTPGQGTRLVLDMGYEGRDGNLADSAR